MKCTGESGAAVRVCAKTPAPEGRESRRTTRYLVSLLLFLTTVGVSIPAFSAAERGRSPSSDGTSTDKPPEEGEKKPDPREEKPAPRPAVSYEGGLLDVSTRNRPLSRLLDSISRQARVAFILDPAVDDERVSVEFEALPLDEGIRQILKNQDAFYFYGVNVEPRGDASDRTDNQTREKTTTPANEESPQEPSAQPAEGPTASLMAVWVYLKGRGQGIRPVPPESWASTRELRGWLSDPDPEMRARAAEALIERGGPRARQTLLDALQDRDEQVRSRALYGALAAGVELPIRRVPSGEMASRHCRLPPPVKRDVTV